MLRLPEFEFHRPATVEEAAELLAERGTAAVPIAGGTDVLPKMKRKQVRPDAVVSLAGIDGMAGIRVDDTGLEIGGQTTLDRIATHRTVQDRYPALAEAAAAVATPSIRRMGTIGGNLCQDPRCDKYDRPLDWRESVGYCWKAPGPDGYPPGEVTEDDVPCRTAPGTGRCWANFSSDTAPALIALDADVNLVGGDGERVIPLADLYIDSGLDPLAKEHHELITAIVLPPAEGVRSTYRKYAPRESFDFPEMGVAVAVDQDDDGTVSDATIVFTGLGSRPVVAEEAAAMLVGERPTGDLLEQVGERATRGTRPMDNTAVHPTHRKQVGSVYTTRALESVLTLD